MGHHLWEQNQSINIQSQNVDFVKAFLNMVNIDIKEEVVMQDEPLKISLDTQMVLLKL